MNVHRVAILAGAMMTVGIFPVVWAQEPKEKDLEKELEELRREVRELREWKDRMEQERGQEQEQEKDKLWIPAYDEGVDESAGIAIVTAPGAFRLELFGQVRARWEYHSHLYSPLDPNGEQTFDLTLLRTRVGLNATLTDGVGAIVEIQDVRTFGEEGSTTADTEGVDLKLGEIVITRPFELPLELEVGRFVMVYGAERLIGALDWVNQGRMYDGIRVRAEGDGPQWLDAFGVRVRDDTEGDLPEQSLAGLYGGILDVFDSADLEAYALVVGDQQDAIGERGNGDTLFWTLGSRIAGGDRGVDYSGELAYQFGRVNGDRLSAFAFALTAGYTFEDTSCTPRIGFEVDYASGNRSLTDGKTEQFQVLFPTNHLHYGYADLAAWSNLVDFHTSVSIRPVPTVRVALDWHNLNLVESEGGWINAGGATIRPGVASAGESLANEIDLTAWWNATKALSFLGGVALFIPGEFVRDTGDDPDATFAYVQARVVF